MGFESHKWYNDKNAAKHKKRECCQGTGPKCKGLDLFSSSALDFHHVFSFSVTERGSRRINELISMYASHSRKSD